MIGIVFVALWISFSRTVIGGRWKLFQIFGRIGLLAAIWQVITGIGLYFLEPEEFYGNWLFWTKIGLFLIDGILANRVIDLRVREVAGRDEEKTPASVLSTAFLVSFLILASIVTLGVLL